MNSLHNRSVDMDREELEYQLQLHAEVKNRLYKKDPWAWFCDQVKTKDEATQRMRPFPADLLYLKDLTQILQEEQMVAIPKSRRMFATWQVSLWCLYNARFHENHAIFFQSETESKSAFVLDQRIKLVEDAVSPLFKKEYEQIKTKSGMVGKITFKETGSYIWAIPQGDGQIRSYTPSILVMDESEFQPEAHAALKAALATVEKDSQIILLSSSNGPNGIIADICSEVGFSKFK